MRKAAVLFTLLTLALLAAMAATVLIDRAPPLRAHSQRGEFDAPRTKAELTAILGDQSPHPADTLADDLVRARLVGELRKHGLDPVVHDQFVCNALYKQRGVSCARVRNVIAMLGPPTGRALLLNAHYDSTPVGPGAADDGIGVAALLGVAAELKGRQLARPVILLFNEGEELGLLGARAFLSDPLSRNVDSLVNLEARGVRGPVNMFETSRPNAAPIRIFAASVKHPVANSLSTDVYRLMPNYTDVNSFAERGWMTLNLAPIGNETRYHSPGDEVAALDLATLQHMGDQTLALAEALSDRTPAATSGNRIFMDIAGRHLIVLPLVVGIGVLATLLVGFFFVAMTRGGLLLGSVVVLGTMTGAAMASWLLLALIGAARPGMFWRAEPIWTHLTVSAATILVATILLAAFGSTLDRTRLRSAFWFLFVLAGGAIGLVAPGGIIFFIFPPLLAAIGLLLSRWWRHAERAGAWASIALLWLTWGAMIGLLGELLNDGPMWIFSPLGSLLILPVLIEARPLIAAAGWRKSIAAPGALTLLGLIAVAAAPAYSADRQQRLVIQHVTDAVHGKSWWSVLNDGAALPARFAGVWRRGKLPLSDRVRWLSPAPADAAARAPAVQLISQVQAGNERTLTIRLRANGNEHIDLIAPADARITSAGAGGFVRPIDQGAGGRYSISCFGRSCDGAVLQLTIDKLEQVVFIIVGGRAQLPPSAAPLLSARPAHARPQYNRDEAIAFAALRL